MVRVQLLDVGDETVPETSQALEAKRNESEHLITATR